jgi:hypothetical protein
MGARLDAFALSQAAAAEAMSSSTPAQPALFDSRFNICEWSTRSRNRRNADSLVWCIGDDRFVLFKKTRPAYSCVTKNINFICFLSGDITLGLGRSFSHTQQRNAFCCFDKKLN